MRNHSKKGFTLAELLIVVAILGVLIAVAIPVFTSSLEKAKKAVDDANFRSAQAVASSLTLLGELNVEGVGTITSEDLIKKAAGTKSKALYLLKDGSFTLTQWGDTPPDAYLAQASGVGHPKGFAIGIIASYDANTKIKITCAWI